MSGGYFSYDQYKIEYIKEEIETLIYNNEKKDDFDYANNFKLSTLKEFKKAIYYLERAYIYAQRIDWLVSADDSEKTFHERLKEDLSKLTKNSYSDEVTQQDIDEVLLKSKYNFDDFEEDAEDIKKAIEEVELEPICNEYIGGVVPLPHEIETSSLEKRINDLEKRQQEFEEEVLKQLTDLHNEIVNHINYNHK